MADYSRIDEICCQVGTVVAGPTVPALNLLGGQVQGFGTFFDRTANLNIVPVNEVDNYGGSVQMDYSAGALSFTSITAYRELQNFFRSDIDYTAADIANEQRDQGVKTFTQEFRVASDFDGPFNFLLGGFYFDEKITQESRIENGDQIRDFFRDFWPAVTQLTSCRARRACSTLSRPASLRWASSRKPSSSRRC